MTNIRARWVKVQTSPGRDDGRVYAATYRRIV